MNGNPVSDIWQEKSDAKHLRRLGPMKSIQPTSNRTKWADVTTTVKLESREFYVLHFPVGARKGNEITIAQHHRWQHESGHVSTSGVEIWRAQQARRSKCLNYYAWRNSNSVSDFIFFNKTKLQKHQVFDRRKRKRTDTFLSNHDTTRQRKWRSRNGITGSKSARWAAFWWTCKLPCDTHEIH